MDFDELYMMCEEEQVLYEIEEDYYEPDYYEPDYDECGFNPYMGCYDFDC